MNICSRHSEGVLNGLSERSKVSVLDLEIKRLKKSCCVSTGRTIWVFSHDNAGGAVIQIIKYCAWRMRNG